MKSTAKLILLMFVLSISLSMIANAAVQPITNATYKVIKLDIAKNCVEVIKCNAACKCAHKCDATCKCKECQMCKQKACVKFNVLIDSKTKVFYNKKQARWTDIKIGDFIIVTGEFTKDVKTKANNIKAKEIKIKCI